MDEFEVLAKCAKMLNKLGPGEAHRIATYLHEVADDRVCEGIDGIPSKTSSLKDEDNAEERR